MNTSTTIPAVKTPRPPYLGIDIGLVLIVTALLVIGFFFVFSSSWQYTSFNDLASTALVGKQALAAGAGILLAVFVNVIDYRRFKRWVIFAVIACLVLLVLVLMVGDERNGATRSLLNGSIQPAEISKVVIILYLSFWLSNRKDVLNDISLGLVPLIMILGMFMGLIVGQPDISTAATIFGLGILLFFLAGGSIPQIVLVFLMVGILGGAFVMLQSTGQHRITDWLAGLQNPDQSSNHVLRSIEAIVRGGFFGVGLGRSSTKFTGLPVPWTDSIFAVITEETGLVGALTVIALYFGLLWRGMRIARNAPDLLGRLIASGVTYWIMLEALINMGQMVNLVPFAGNALPLISAGGSNLVAILVGVGLLQNVARASRTEQVQGEGRAYSAVVDLRRRDRRRRVPRPVRPAVDEE